MTYSNTLYGTRRKPSLWYRMGMWSVQVLLIILAFLPTIIAGGLWWLVNPVGFWQRIAFVFVVGGAWLVLQIWAVIGAFAATIKLWE